MPARIRCHVMEVTAHDGWLSRRGGTQRELLPWADPYIAGLMRRLEDRYSRDEDNSSDPFELDNATAGAPAFDDGWQEDAFMPRPVESLRFHSYPPVYGGFPLLEDSSEQDHEDAF